MQNAVTTSDPRARGVIPATPFSEDLRPWRSIYFYAEVLIAATDLNTRSADLRFSVTGGRDSVNRANLGFPRGTRLFLNVVTTSGGHTVPLREGIQFGGFSRADLNVQLTGAPSRYPDDEYTMDITSASIIASFPSGRETYYGLDLFGARLLPGTGIRYKFEPGLRLRFPSRRSCYFNARMTFARGHDRTFVWLMSLTPLVLILLVLNGLGPVLTRRGTGARQSVERVGIEAGVAFLSILPLRAVLVPGSLTSVTRVDYVLAAQLSFLVLFLVAAPAIGELRDRAGSTDAEERHERTR